jgi:hypothetical protein
MSLTNSEKEELEQLRELAAKVIMSPFDRAFFDVQRIIDNPFSNRADIILANALVELKRKIQS